ncbi:MAG TPA: molybdopterin-dependent oxidoreductase [Syntrophorhabdales bacterium]|nr:molybdopterin-dependent oxidoreductase [Syntrophorhabdales bacterium]
MGRPERKESIPVRKGSAPMAVLLVGVLVGMMGLAAALFGGDQPSPAPAKAAVNEPDARGSSKSGTCAPAPLIVPPTPAKLPGYAELDPSTGLHVTGTMKEIDVAHYRLEVTGKVSRSLSLTYDELRCMPRIQARPTLVCPGFFTDVATWAGTPLKHIVDLAGPQKGATEIRLTGADGYSVSRSLADATAPANFLAYEWEGKALPRLHGFPVRAVFPGLEGNQWVKWVVKIEVF